MFINFRSLKIKLLIFVNKINDKNIFIKNKFKMSKKHTKNDDFFWSNYYHFFIKVLSATKAKIEDNVVPKSLKMQQIFIANSL